MAVITVRPRTDSVITVSSVNFDKADKSTDYKVKIKGYFFAFLVILTYTVAVVSAQLAVDSVPRFQSSLMRYITQSVLTLSSIGICRKKPVIEVKKIWMVVTVAVFDFGYNYSFYQAAAYLPVGNMEGIFTALVIVILGIYDICRKKCASSNIISGVVCATGLLLLIQPWNIAMEGQGFNNRTIPCEQFGVEEESTEFFTIRNDEKWSTSDSVSTVPVTEYLSTTVSATNNTTMIAGNDIDNTILGYILIVSAALCMSAISVLIEKLTDKYHPAVVSFWIASCDALISAVLMSALETPSLPSATYCLLFTFLLTTLSAMNAFFSHVTLSYLLPSQTALVLSLSMVVLFIVQNTLLFDVHPGRQNAEEIIGAVVTFVGAVLCPISMLCRRICRKEQIYNFG